MELRTYWNILRRRWLLILVPAVVVLAVSLLTYSPPAPLYNVGVRFIAGQEPTIGSDTSDEERNNAWTSSEYLTNSLTDWVRTGHFAAAVSSQLAEQGIEVAPAAIVAGVAADNARSTMTLSFTYHDPAVLQAIMDAAIIVLQERNADALPQLGGQPAEVIPLDPAIVNQIPPALRSRLDLPLRVLLALAAGLGLALLIEYLDPTLRARDEVEGLGLPVLGEIPKK
jgi:capsular polysaccharide biosynthesis protein